MSENTVCHSRGPMFGDQRPVCELPLDHETPHGAEVDGVWVQWERVVSPELMLLPLGATIKELDELTLLLTTLTRYEGTECRRIAHRILEAGYRRIPEGGTAMMPAAEDN